MARRTLSEVFRSKYDLLAEYQSALNSFQNIKLRKPPSKNLGRLVSITLDHEQIDTLDSVSFLTECCPRLVELDLSYNSITSWSEVLDILQKLPKLQLLNISFNPLEMDQAGTMPSGPPLPTNDLKTLILNGTNCTWARVENLLHHLPCLQELHLSCNELTGPPAEQKPYDTIKRLHVNNNKLADWAHYEAIGRTFPQLEVLIARCNPLSSVSTTSERSSSFFHLTSLTLSGSPLVDPGDFFTIIRQCQALCNLRLQEIPLLDLWPSNLQRDCIIACTPTITCLNGSMVNDKEREKAERACLRFYTEDAPTPAWLQQRYDELLDKHGTPQKLAEVHLGPPTHLNLTVHFKAKNKTAPLQVPPDIKTSELCKIVAKALDFEEEMIPKLRLYLVDTVAKSMGHYGVSGELNRDKPLYSYKAHDDDEILVRLRP